MIGTPDYFSPEQARGEPLDPRSDLYSLGVVLYYMLAGRLPFLGANPLAVSYMQATQEPPPPSAFAAVPPALEAICMKAMAKDPAKRFKNAREMRAALRTLGDLPATQSVTVIAASVVADPQAARLDHVGPQCKNEGGHRRLRRRRRAGRRHRRALDETGPAGLAQPDHHRSRRRGAGGSHGGGHTRARVKPPLKATSRPTDASPAGASAAATATATGDRRGRLPPRAPAIDDRAGRATGAATTTPCCHRRS